MRKTVGGAEPLRAVGTSLSGPSSARTNTCARGTGTPIGGRWGLSAVLSSKGLGLLKMPIRQRPKGAEKHHRLQIFRQLLRFG
jgi:hypothetical protein